MQIFVYAPPFLHCFSEVGILFFYYLCSNMKKEKFFSLLMVFLMLAAAAISVNKKIFNREIGAVPPVTASSPAELSASITKLDDGSLVIHTADLPGNINGYAGPVPLDIKISDGKIAGVEALPNVESPSFFERAAAILGSWTGMSPAEAMDAKVDAVSGATYSSLAIINNFDNGVAYYLGTESAHGANIPWKMWVALAVTLAACIIPLFVKNKIYHTVQLIANIFVLGFWCGQFLDYALILKYISGGLVLPAGLVAAAMLIAAFVYPLFGHPQHYCTHVCPLGAAQQLVAQVCGYKIHLSASVLKGLDWFRKILWAILMLLLWADCFTGWMDLELFQAFQFESASTGIIIAACVFVALSAVVSRPYCRFVCPTGSLLKRSENIG